MQAIIAAILSFLGNLFLGSKLGEEREKTRNANTRTDDALAEATRHADTPVTVLDAARLLERRAAAKRNVRKADD